MSNHCGLIKRPCSNNKTPYQINELLGQHPTSHAKTLECVHPGFGGKSGADVYFIIIFFFFSLYFVRTIYFIDIGAGSLGMPGWTWPWHRLAYLTGSSTSHRRTGQNHGTRGKTPWKKARARHLATRGFGAQQVMRTNALIARST